MLRVSTAMRTLVAFVLFLASFRAFSQTTSPPDLGSWAMYFGQIRLHDKWSLHTEAQFRDYGIVSQPEQILLRGGINYHYSPKAIVTAGYARITNYSYDDESFQSPTVTENRGWQQFIMRNSIGRIAFEHRYRLEQRWIKTNGNATYLDRARYLLRATVPINKKEMIKDAFFVSFYDEIFLHFSSTPFDRNRLYGALGYQFSPHGNVQFGYLAQTTSAKTRHSLQLAVNYTVDLRKKK